MSYYLMADDLSGVLEAGAAFRLQGWRVTLPFGDAAAPVANGELRLVSTESRNLAPDAAGRAVKAALAAGTQGDARLLFKKIDSTLRGPIGAELAVVLAELKPPLVVLCPANPAAGRTVRHGILRVFGVPLTGTDFASDPHWPATESSVPLLLASQGVPVSGHIKLPDLRRDAAGALRAALAAGPGPVVTVDAETQADLEKIVHAARRQEPGALFVGSGALASVVAAEMAPPGRSAPPLPRLGSLLFLCGTAHPATARQLEHLAKRAKVPVLTHVVGKDSIESTTRAVEQAWAGRRVAAVRLTARTRTAEASAEILAAAAGCAREAMQSAKPEALFLTGGETAWAVCRALEGEILEVLAEIEPGMVVSALRRRGANPLIVITKPGGFGDEMALARVVEGQ